MMKETISNNCDCESIQMAMESQDSNSVYERTWFFLKKSPAANKKIKF